MQFKHDASVHTSAGEDVGHVDRVVLDPRSKEVTHIVVRKGLLFKTDKVVPVSLIDSATENRIVLREDAGDLDSLPEYEETYYVPLEDEELRRAARHQAYAPASYLYPWYPTPAGLAAPALTGYGYAAGPRQVAETERNIPEGTVALKEGAKVVTQDGEHIGNIDEVLTDPQADRATHFVISQGLLLKSRKLIPTAWVGDMSGDQVRLAVGSQLVQSLREYER